jgi:hypothetical protein
VPAAGPDLYGKLHADIPITTDRIQVVRARLAPVWSHHALTYAVDEPDKDVSGDDSKGVEGGDFGGVRFRKNAEVYTGDHIKAEKNATPATTFIRRRGDRRLHRGGRSST